MLVMLLVQERKLSPLEAGGTLKGSEAAGKVCFLFNVCAVRPVAPPCLKLLQLPCSGFVKPGQCQLYTHNPQDCIAVYTRKESAAAMFALYNGPVLTSRMPARWPRPWC